MRTSLARRELSADSNDGDGANLSVGLGVLAGLNDHTPNYTLKLSIEIHY